MQKERNAGDEVGLMKRFMSALRKNRKLELACYAVVALLVVALYLVGVNGEKRREERVSVAETGGVTTEDTEARLREVLSCIRGAGRVEVMITYEQGAELIPAMSTKVNSTSSESTGSAAQSASTQRTEDTTVATVSGAQGDTPIVLTEKKPTVRGVIVVAEGAADIRVKLDLQRAVCAVLDVPLSKIEVFVSALPGA